MTTAASSTAVSATASPTAEAERRRRVGAAPGRARCAPGADGARGDVPRAPGIQGGCRRPRPTRHVGRRRDPRQHRCAAADLLHPVRLRRVLPARRRGPAGQATSCEPHLAVQAGTATAARLLPRVHPRVGVALRRQHDAMGGSGLGRSADANVVDRPHLPHDRSRLVPERGVALRARRRSCGAALVSDDRPVAAAEPHRGAARAAAGARRDHAVVAHHAARCPGARRSVGFLVCPAIVGADVRRRHVARARAPAASR